MRRATGNKAPQSSTGVSIQQSLDGHSFSAEGLSGDFPGEGPVDVEVLTPRTLLLPAEDGDPDEKEAVELLAAAGMPAGTEECVIRSGECEGCIAAMALNAEAVRIVREKLGDRARFTTPLLAGPRGDGKTVSCRRTAGLLYIKVYDGGLRFAEVVPVGTDEEALYFFGRLGEAFDLTGSTLYLSGDGADRLRKAMKKRFKRIVCE